MDIVIAGGGVIGLTLGRRLLHDGHRVTIVDRYKAGHGASWAAAGILAGIAETHPEKPDEYALALESQRIWPAFRRELEQETGLDIGYYDRGTLLPALDADQLTALHRDYVSLKAQDVSVDWLERGDLSAREPNIAPNIEAAIICPLDRQVDSRRLVAALTSAFLSRGGRLIEYCTVDRVVTRGHRARGIVAGDMAIDADAVILACGWQTGAIAVDGLVTPRLVPVKGQIVSFDSGRPLLQHVIHAGSIYLVQRSPAEIILGATVESGVSDLSLDFKSLEPLIQAACEIVPALEQCDRRDHWAGVRPASSDGLPIIGASQIENLLLATGHYRNGIFWAPATAEIIRNILAREISEQEAVRFSPQRFAA